MNSNVTIEIPIMVNHVFFQGEMWHGSEVRVIEELVKQRGSIVISDFIGSKIEPTFTYQNSKDINQIELSKKFQIEASGCEHHLLSMHFMYDLGDFFDYDEFHDLLAKFYIIFSIVSPGALEFNNSILNYNDKQIAIKSSYRSFSIKKAVESSAKVNWPKFEAISIQDTCKWFYDKEGFELGLGETQINKAIVAYINSLIKPRDNSLQLFWLMQSLEILYCSRSEKLSESLEINTRLFLGDRSDYKKLVKKMYDTRSRFIHGNMPNSTVGFFLTEAEEHSIFLEALDECVSVAYSILIATFRKLIFLNKNQLEFEIVHRMVD